MKKLVGLVCSIAMLFSLTACGSKIEDEALDAFEAAIQNTMDMKSADYIIKMDTDSNGSKSSMNVSGSYNVETANPQISAILDMEVDGEKQEGYIQMYVNDGSVYLNLMDIMKQKQALSAVMNGQAMPPLNFDKKDIKLPKDEMKKYLKEAKLKGDTIKMIFDTKKIMDDSKEMSKDNSQLESMMKAMESIDVKDFELEMNLKSKMVSKLVLKVDVTKKEGDETQNAKGVITFSFEKINKVKTINFPDFSTYLEGEAGGLPIVQ